MCAAAGRSVVIQAVGAHPLAICAPQRAAPPRCTANSQPVDMPPQRASGAAYSRKARECVPISATQELSTGRALWASRRPRQPRQGWRNWHALQRARPRSEWAATWQAGALGPSTRSKLELSAGDALKKKRRGCRHACAAPAGTHECAAPEASAQLTLTRAGFKRVQKPACCAPSLCCVPAQRALPTLRSHVRVAALREAPKRPAGFALRGPLLPCASRPAALACRAPGAFCLLRRCRVCTRQPARQLHRVTLTLTRSS